jgi:rRNA-processing protein FCF1
MISTEGRFFPPTQVLLDTSFIMTLVKQHRDPWAEVKDLIKGRVKVQTLDLIVFELEHLARTAPAATCKWANTSLMLVARKKDQVVQHKPGPSNVDVALMAHALAEREVTAIATVDREMRTILAANGIPAIWPKARYGLLSSGF